LYLISTAEAVGSVGSSPIFVDIDDYFCIDADLIEAKISPRTKAIIPVHLYGQPADMGRIMEIARKHGLKVMEDCAQAHCARFGGQMVSNFGDCASFSFYPGKNLGAFGDAGAMTTNNQELAGAARRIANHGQEGKHNHLTEGRNSRLDGIQAAILSAELPSLPQWTHLRQKHARTYDQLLADLPISLPKVRPNGEHVWHLYVIRSQRRDALMAFLETEGIGTALHYPIPMPFMPAYAHLGHKESDFPRALAACNEILSLPMYPEMTGEQQLQVKSAIAKFFAQ